MGNTEENRLLNDIKGSAERNQKQMNQNPVEFFFMNINNCRLILFLNETEIFTQIILS